MKIAINKKNDNAMFLYWLIHFKGDKIDKNLVDFFNNFKMDDEHGNKSAKEFFKFFLMLEQEILLNVAIK